MNDEQVNEYMQALLSGKQKVEDFLEQKALERFGSITTEIAHGQQRLQQLAAEAEQIRNAVQQLIGQRVAYSQLLVAAEDARRPKVDLPAPISLAALRDKAGADRVEAIDSEGNVVDSSENEAPGTDTEEAGESEAPMPDPPQARFIKEGQDKPREAPSD